jgi:hypothetical protein
MGTPAAVPAALHEDALGVAERAEALDAVVLAHAARADAAEGKVVLRDVHDGPVDGDVAGGRAVEDLAPVGAVVAEVVERERSWSCVDVVDGVVDVAVGEDREDGAEDLLVGDAHVVGDAEHDGRCEGVRAAGRFARPVTDLDDPCPAATGVVDQVGEDRVLFVVDDRGVVLAGRAVAGLSEQGELIAARLAERPADGGALLILDAAGATAATRIGPERRHARSPRGGTGGRVFPAGW